MSQEEKCFNTLILYTTTIEHVTLIWVGSIGSFFKKHYKKKVSGLFSSVELCVAYIFFTLYSLTVYRVLSLWHFLHKKYSKLQLKLHNYVF